MILRFVRTTAVKIAEMGTLDLQGDRSHGVVAKQDMFKVVYNLTLHMTYKNVNDGEQVLIKQQIPTFNMQGGNSWGGPQPPQLLANNTFFVIDVNE